MDQFFSIVDFFRTHAGFSLHTDRMAIRIPDKFVPIEMLVTIHSKQYPDLAAQLEDIARSSANNPLEAQDQIRQTVQGYEMYLAKGRIKPKALCS